MANEIPSKKVLSYVDELPAHLTLEVPEGESLSLQIAAFSDLKDTQIDVRVAANSQFEGAFADFSRGSFKFILNVHLIGEGSRCDWHLASLSKGPDQKRFETSVYHETPHSEAEMTNYGIARDQSRLYFAGVSEIKKGSFKTKTRQTAKIIVFDPQSLGRASPILKIGENDVDASHAAVVGRLNEDHLFYLESRGLSLEEAKRLITLGYLKPVEDFFASDETKKRIDEAIEGGI